MSITLKKTTDEQGSFYTLIGNGVPENYTLSEVNCRAIELGIDLYEKATAFASKRMDLNPIYANGLYYGFLEGFSERDKMLSDKSFSEGDVKKAIELAQSQSFKCEANGYDKKCYCTNEIYCQHKHFMSESEIIQSLQQTEWEVEIVTEPLNLDELRAQHRGFLNAETRKPKYDLNGDLILKRV